MLNSVTDKMLPCDTPSCWWSESEKMLATQTEKFLTVKHLEINVGLLPTSPALYKYPQRMLPLNKSLPYYSL